MDVANWKIHPAYIAVILMAISVMIDMLYMIPLLMEYSDYFTFKDILTMCFGSIVMITAMVYLFLTKHTDLVKVLSVCALTVGLICMMDSYLLLYEYKDFLEGDLAAFLQGVINFAVALMLTINAMTYARGLSRSTSMINYAVLGLLLLFVLFVIVEFHEGATVRDVYEEYKSSLPYYALLVLMMMMLRSDSVKVNTTMYIIKSSMRDMRNSLTSDGMSILRSTVERLDQLNGGKMWCQSYSFLLETFYHEKYAVHMEDMNGRTAVRISSLENRSGMNGFRFIIKAVWMDTGDVTTCDLVRIYSEEGFFIQLIVRDSMRIKTKKVPKRGVWELACDEPGTKAHQYKVRKIRIVEDVKRFVLGPGYEKKIFE